MRMTCLPLCSWFPPLCSGHGASPVTNPFVPCSCLPAIPCKLQFNNNKNTKNRARAESPLPAAPGDHQDSTIEPEFSVLTAVRTEHNDIMIVDTPDSRVLLLDSTHNIHSIHRKGTKWTDSYWDEFASLPAIVPQGPIGILGLGGGTAAHLILDLWPSLKLEGWEIDHILIDKARDYLGLSDLEKCNQAGGVLVVHIDDALSPSAVVTDGFAGMVVDLFSNGKVIPQLQAVTTWLELNAKLMPGGRIMVNCGGAHAETSYSGVGTDDTQVSATDGALVQNSTIMAMCKAFPGNLSWKRMEEGESDNFLALTGPPPNLDAWSAAVPAQLSSNVKRWKPCALA